MGRGTNREVARFHWQSLALEIDIIGGRGGDALARTSPGDRGVRRKLTRPVLRPGRRFYIDARPTRGVDPLEPDDITAPASRHNVHVTRRADLTDVRDWTQAELYAAVERADAEDAVVVIDYGRALLYLADRADVTFVPPRRLGLSGEPGLRVRTPTVYDPETDAVSRLDVDERLVAPEFDVLIPALNWESRDEDSIPIEPEYRERPSGSPHTTGG